MNVLKLLLMGTIHGFALSIILWEHCWRQAVCTSKKISTFTFPSTFSKILLIIKEFTLWLALTVRTREKCDRWRSVAYKETDILRWCRITLTLDLATLFTGPQLSISRT